MRVMISRDGDVRLAEPKSLDDLRVDCDLGSQDLAAVDLALKSALAGVVRGNHAELSTAWLESSALSAGAAPEWSAGFANMLAYADTRGWISSPGHVRAHIEWGKE